MPMPQSWCLCLVRLVGGTALLVGAVSTLMRYESLHIQAYRRQQGKEHFMASVPTVASYHPKYNGQLIHVVGQIKATSDTLCDPLWGVCAPPHALDFERQVLRYEGFQKWRLLSSFLDDKTLASRYTTASAFSLMNGTFDVPPLLLKIGVHNYQPLTEIFSVTQIPQDTIASLNYSHVSVYQDWGYSFTASNSSLTLGDVRVTFQYVPAQVVSVLAQQNGPALEAFVEPERGRIFKIWPGNASAMDMFPPPFQEREDITVTIWFVRLLTLLLLGGTMVVLRGPLFVLAGYLSGWEQWLDDEPEVISFRFAVTVLTVIMTVMWIPYRPLACLFWISVWALWVWRIWPLRSRRRNRLPAVASAVATPSMWTEVEMK